MNCKTRKAITSLIEKHTLKELKEMEKETSMILSIMSMGIPADKDARNQKVKMTNINRCIKMAIAYIKESEKHQA